MKTFNRKEDWNRDPEGPQNGFYLYQVTGKGRRDVERTSVYTALGASEILRGILRQHPWLSDVERQRIEDGILMEYGSASIEVRNAISVTCTLQVGAYPDAWVQVDGEGKFLPESEIYLKAIQCEVSWSSCNRDLKTAQACMNLYQKMVALGMDIEVAFDGYLVLVERGV